MNWFDDPNIEKILSQRQTDEESAAQRTETFIRMRSEGKSLRECAEQLQISLGTASSWNYHHATAIKTLRQDIIRSTYNLNPNEELAHQTAMLDKIYQALQNQDLSRVKPKDLVIMMNQIIKYQQAQLDRRL